MRISSAHVAPILPDLVDALEQQAELREVGHRVAQELLNRCASRLVRGIEEPLENLPSAIAKA